MISAHKIRPRMQSSLDSKTIFPTLTGHRCGGIFQPRTFIDIALTVRVMRYQDHFLSLIPLPRRLKYSGRAEFILNPSPRQDDQPRYREWFSTPLLTKHLSTISKRVTVFPSRILHLRKRILIGLFAEAGAMEAFDSSNVISPDS